MVAEQNELLDKMKPLLVALHENDDMTRRKFDTAEEGLKKVVETNDSLGDAFAVRLTKIEAEANFAEGRINSVIQGVQNQLTQIEDEAKLKFEETAGRVHLVDVAANQMFVV